MPDVAKMSGICSSSYHCVKTSGLSWSGLVILELTQRIPGPDMVAISLKQKENNKGFTNSGSEMN